MNEQLILAGDAARLLGVSSPYLSVLEKRGSLLPALRFQKGRWGLRIYRLEDVERVAAERQTARATMPV